ncbi:MAG: thioredoxin [Candidatus Paceibacterota bacterium]
MDINITDKNFEQEVLRSAGIMLVDFWAPWCGPCQMMGPIIEEVAKEFEGRIKVYKLNVDENPKTASDYEILSIPTLKFFKEGKIVDEMTGLKPKDMLVEKINNLLGIAQ